MSDQNRYSQIIERVFLNRYRSGASIVGFSRVDIIKSAKALRIDLPKNVGDIVYSFRYRVPLPSAIASRAGKGKVWVIRPGGSGLYRFETVVDQPILPNKASLSIKVPNATPGLVAKYRLSDEQALLAIVRYNRLVDIFTGVTCYSLQNHLRTAVPGMGQVETDELYLGVDKKGCQYVFPIQAKGGRDRLSIVQIEQDLAVCAHKFHTLVCRPLAAQFAENNVIALFEFSETKDGVRIASERHYKLVPPEEISEEDIVSYRR